MALPPSPRGALEDEGWETVWVAVSLLTDGGLGELHA